MGDVRTLLFIDGDPTHTEAFRSAVLAANDGPFQADCVGTLSAGLERLRQKDAWAIFVSLSLPDSQGLGTLERILEAAPGLPVLVLAGADDKAIATEALRRGAKDYLLQGRIDMYSFDRAIRNMVEREAAEEALFTQKEYAQVTLNSIGDAILSTDLFGRVTYLNAVAERMTGWLLKEAVTKPLAEVFHVINSVSRVACPNPMEVAIRENKTVGLAADCILIRRDGQESHIEDSAAPIHDRSGAIAGAVMVFHDVSVSWAILKETSRLAYHDSLTNLPNRVLLKDRLTQVIATAHRNGAQVAVLFLDLDGFKNINDSLGHAVGDTLLRSVAARLIGAIRGTDTVARQGGDEFVVLLTEIKHAEDAGISARKIVSALAAPHKLGAHELRVTASIGVSTYPADGEDAETLMKNADTAMYQAKLDGPNSYRFFKKDMNLHAVERQSIESDLNRALEHQQFALLYQPKIKLETGEISGAEALIRWQHPDRGPVLPAEFIPIAEECGLILPIGQWVLRETCTQVQEWVASGLRVSPVAVNVSSLEFRSEAFLENLRTVLKETGLDPSYLDLELTETALMLPTKSTIAVLGELKSIGVRLSLDDFGTGYSNLGYLKWFPIDFLKIDQSFVRNIASDAGDATLVSTMIAMARSLKKCVVAEGVETEEQLKFLQAQSCDEAQGYYFARPIPAAEFANLLKKGIRSNWSAWAPNAANASGMKAPWLANDKQ